jgi:small subunit ribosomal protein S20
MADHKSAIKRQRQSVKNAERNRHFKTAVKTAIKKARTAAERKTPEAEHLAKEAISLVDKTRGKGILPANRAARYVSKLARSVSKKG